MKSRVKTFLKILPSAALKALAFITAVNLGTIGLFKIVESASSFFDRFSNALPFLFPAGIVDAALFFVRALQRIFIGNCDEGLQQAINIVAVSAVNLVRAYIYLILTVGVHWFLIFLFADWLFVTGKVKNKGLTMLLLYIASIALFFAVIILLEGIFGFRRPPQGTVCLAG